MEVENFAIRVKTMEEMCEQDRVRDELILRGATFPMIYALFGDTFYAVSNRQKLLGVARKGRTKQPDDDMQEKIWLLWNEYQHLPERERYLRACERLSERYGLTLEQMQQDGLAGALYSIISSWEQQQSVAEASASSKKKHQERSVVPIRVGTTGQQ